MESLSKFKESSLCFNKDEFSIESFSIDKFVSDCRKYVSLETMLEDLGLYHKVLCCSLFELINKDYSDFVNLSSNLIGFDKSLKNLISPLEIIVKEIEADKINYELLTSSCKSLFESYKNAQQRKICVNHFFCLLEGLKQIKHLKERECFNDEETFLSLSVEDLEHISLEFNLCNFHLSKLTKEEMEGFVLNFLSEKIIEEFEEISMKIQFQLQTFFLKSLEENDTFSLRKILDIYSIIDKKDQVLFCFAKKVVKPFMQHHVTQEKVIEHGISKVFENVLHFIRTDCLGILSTVPAGYDIVIDCIWPEFLSCFDLIASMYTYAPGNPGLFMESFTAMLFFLDSFEQCCCTSQAKLKKFRNTKSYETFVSKWNVEIYYKIRFQEIAGMFEKSVLHSVLIKAEQGKKCDNYLLNVTDTLSDSVSLCWSSKVFLTYGGLGAAFFRLTLELISRYRIFMETFLKNYNSEEVLLSPIDVALIFHDVEQLTKKLDSFFIETICSKIKSNKVIEGAFENAMCSLKNILPLATDAMLKSLIVRCCLPLKMIADVPKLYRKTNRKVPTKPSSYVSQIFVPIEEFVENAKEVLDKEFLASSVVKPLCEKIIKNCIVHIQDVLLAIKKVQDSLKILKRVRDTSLSHKNVCESNITTDDDKIRQQLCIDASCIEEIMVDKIGISRDLELLVELKELVNVCKN